MALSMPTDFQLTFYEKTFGVNHAMTQLVSKLIGQGYKFNVTFADVKAIMPSGQVSVCTPALNTTALMKGQGNPLMQQSDKAKIETWLKGIGGVQPETPVEAVAPSEELIEGDTLILIGNVSMANKIKVIKALQAACGWSLVTAKEFVTAVEGTKAKPGTGADIPPKPGVLPVLPVEKATPLLKELKALNVDVTIGKGVTCVVEPITVAFDIAPVTVKLKPVPEVLNLREAKAVGQKVRGTSSGSTYTTIAVGDRIKIAAKLTGGKASIRAEWEGATADELKKLEAAGLDIKSDYASMHLEKGEVSLAKLIGGFLMDTGLKFHSQVASSDELAGV